MVVCVQDTTAVGTTPCHTLDVSDKIEVNKSAPIIANIGVDSISVKTEPELGLTQVSLSDAYQVIPFAKRVTVDYELPDSITQGLFIDMDDLEASLLDEISNREIAIIDTMSYSKDYADGVESNVLTTIEANYIGMPGLEAYILSTDFTNAVLTYDTGTGQITGTLQDMHSDVVETQNAQAGYAEDLRVLVEDGPNSVSALATRTETLEVAIEGDNGINVRLDTIEGVAAGVFKVWYGAIGDLLVGYIKFEDPLSPFTLRTSEAAVLEGDAQFQYLGGTLGERNDGWVRTDSTAYGWAGGASSILTSPSGAVTGWSYGDGSAASSEFKISADKFSLVNANGTATPLIVDATDPNNVEMEFTGKVTLTGLGVDSGSTVINGDKIQTGTLFSNSIGTEVIYDQSHWSGGVEQGSTVYKMKIDLSQGEIHIR